MLKPVSIILPTYNEKDTIERLLREISAYMPSESEIIVVDDNSPDGTSENVSNLKKEIPEIRLIKRETRGLTSALRDGVKAARFDRVLWLDADFAHPPEVIPGLCRASEEADIAVASRYVPGGEDRRHAFHRRVESMILNRFVRWYVGSSVHDLSSGFVLARKEAVEKIPFTGTYGDYCIDFLVRAERMGYSIKEVPYINSERERGYSKTTESPLQFFRYILLYCRTIFQLRGNHDDRRPE